MKKSYSFPFSCTRILVLLAALLVVSLLGTMSCSSVKNMTFEKIGQEGDTIFITLTSPGVNQISAEDLANQLRKDWQPQLNGHMISVLVFDNTDAPKLWISIWPRRSSMTNEEWTKAKEQIFPHYVAQYLKNIVTGLEQVNIMDRQTTGHTVKTIDFTQK